MNIKPIRYDFLDSLDNSTLFSNIVILVIEYPNISAQIKEARITYTFLGYTVLVTIDDSDTVENLINVLARMTTTKQLLVSENSGIVETLYTVENN